MNTQQIAASLKKLRKNKGLTQKDVAERTLVSPQAVSKWEKGTSIPDASIWPILSEIYETTIDNILAPSNISSLLKNIKIVSQNIFNEIVEDIDTSLEFFVYLSYDQKQELIELFLQKKDYMKYIDQIISLVQAELREFIVKEILQKQDFENLEAIAPFIPPYMAEYILKELEENNQLDILDSYKIILKNFKNKENKNE
ncbi:MAG: helix-turn-helix transcriptional regulator [Defluviitaleaceae bacterium]|nr:helix-turn-helix transcriptional regulator [Defluviitaleaceae bacterium]